MKLKEYLGEKQITPKQFAAKLGLPAKASSYLRVYRWINRDRQPGIDMACRIVELTENKVSINDLKQKKKRKERVNA